MCLFVGIDSQSDLACTTMQGLSLSALRQLLDPPPAAEAQNADLEQELWSALPAGCRGAWEGRPPPGGEVRPGRTMFCIASLLPMSFATLES